MSVCKKNGECLQSCMCDCYDENADKYLDECVCGHREHNGYCPSSCCQLVECRNHKFCGQGCPQWVADCNYGVCMDCAIQMGKHVYTNQIVDCCVCLENKKMIVLKCNHKVCNDCWFKITIYEVENTVRRSLCPLCRNLN